MCEIIKRITENIQSKYQNLTNPFVEEYLSFVNKDILKLFNLFLIKNDLHAFNTILNELKDIIKNNVQYINLVANSDNVIAVDRLGDMHRGGRCTLLVHAETGKYILKPLGVDFILLLNEILTLLNQNKNFDFYLLNVLFNSNQLSKIEFIDNQTCTNNKKFSYHYGALIFILVLLRGVDFHYENIFCINSAPVVVDCESLFYPTIKEAKKYDINATSLIEVNKNDRSILNKINISKKLIKEGISAAYSVVIQNIPYFEKVIKENCKKISRLIFKSTHYYHNLLTNSTHPELFLNAKKREEYIYSCLFGKRDISKSIIHSEVKDLMNFDIPYFYFKNDKLFNSANTSIEKNFLLSSTDEMISNLQKLDIFRDQLIKEI